MANRSLAAKHERAMRQKREAAHIEYTKSPYLRIERPQPITPPDGLKVQALPAGAYRTPAGKGGRAFSPRTYGDFQRLGSAVVWAAAGESFLIKAR